MHNYVQIVNNVVGNGVTRPFWCTLSDGKLVVYKSFNNPEGPRVLISEWIGYSVAILVDIKIPAAGFAYINTETNFNPLILSQLDLKVSGYEGIGFYSEKVDKVFPLSHVAQLSLIANQDDIVKMILLDALLNNADRNPGNLLLQGRKDSLFLYVIDHTHIFKHVMWDSHQLKLDMSDGLSLDKIFSANEYIYSYLREYKSISAQEIKKTITFFRKVVTEKALRDIISVVPNELMLSAEDANALVEYLLFRLSILDEITDYFETGGCYDK